MVALTIEFDTSTMTTTSANVGAALTTAESATFSTGGIQFTYTQSAGFGIVDGSGINQEGRIYLSGTGTGTFGHAGTTVSGFSNLTLNVGNFATGVNTILLQNSTGSTVHSFTDAQVNAFAGLTYTGTFTSIVFKTTGTLNIDSISSDISCFVPDTSIATPDGAVAVQDLKAGDLVMTADGRETPVRWVGVQPIDTRLMHPAKVNPVCITAGALGHGLPERDLRLSPDHAIEIDGHLINAGALVNGATIYQEPGKMPEGFTYYHVETEAHELLLAEGVAAESFIDYSGRETFENGDESTAHIPEMDLPRISSARLVPEHIRVNLLPKIAAE